MKPGRFHSSKTETGSKLGGPHSGGAPFIQLPNSGFRGGPDRRQLGRTRKAASSIADRIGPVRRPPERYSGKPPGAQARAGHSPCRSCGKYHPPLHQCRSCMSDSAKNHRVLVSICRLLQRKLPGERLVQGPFAIGTAEANEARWTMPIVLPPGIVDDRIDTDALDRNSALLRGCHLWLMRRSQAGRQSPSMPVSATASAGDCACKSRSTTLERGDSEGSQRQLVDRRQPTGYVNNN